MTKQKLFKTTAALLFGVVLWVVLALFLASSDRQVARADPGTIYVDVDAPGTPDGLTWSTAFTNVQDALVAAVAGDDIWVAEGVYYPDEGSGQADDDRDSTFQLKRGVALYGGFVGIETSLTERNWTTYVTVLSGDIDRNDATDAKGVVTDTNGIVGTNAYNVVTSQSVTETAVLDGFTITAGNADGGSCPGPWCGGGMLNYSDFGDNWADPTVRHVVFSANRTTGWGGGMYNANDADPVLVDVTFVGNSAYYGGGMANQYGSTPRLNGATFEDNFATWGGGMYSEASSAILTSTTFIGNTASRGGGIYSDDSGHILTDVVFTGNYFTATQGIGGAPYCNGGAGMCHINGGSLSLTRVTFDNNVSNRHGGGLYNNGGTVILDDVVFTGNEANYNGAGFYNEDGNSTLTDVTFDDNDITGPNGSGGGMNHSDGVLVLSAVTFTENTGLSGGGLRIGRGDVTLSDVSFVGNVATSSGGGMYTWSINTVTMTRVTFVSNTAPYGGGFSNTSDSTHMTDVTFTRNTATDQGGGMNNQGNAEMTNVIFYGNSAQEGGGLRNYFNSRTTADNALFVGNQASVEGGGLYNEIQDTSFLTVTNTSFSYNYAGTRGGGFHNYGTCCADTARNAVLSDSIFWGNTAGGYAPQIGYTWDQAVVNYSDVEGGYSVGANIMNADPRFIRMPSPGGDSTWGTTDDDYGDLRLRHNSPVIDGGDDSAVNAVTDLARNPRIMGGAVDMGAYEVEINEVSISGPETWEDFGSEVCARIYFTNTGTLPTSVVITLTHETPSIGGDGLPRRYEVVAYGGSGYQARLELCYEDTDLVQAGIASAEEPNLHAYRWTSSTWQEYSIVDPVNNTVTALDVTQFGIWGLGITTDRPTAASLSGLGTSGRVLPALGISLLLAAGAVGLLVLRRRLS